MLGQGGWILAKFFFCVFIDRDGVKVHKLAKKEQSQCLAILTEQAWSMKDLLYGFWGNISCGTSQLVPSRQDSSILPVQVANHSTGYDPSCLLKELAIYRRFHLSVDTWEKNVLIGRKHDKLGNQTCEV